MGEGSLGEPNSRSGSSSSSKPTCGIAGAPIADSRVHVVRAVAGRASLYLYSYGDALLVRYSTDTWSACTVHVE